MSNVQIIFLNGPSSAGKTEIAKELQQILVEPYLHVGVDMFYKMLPRRYFGRDPIQGEPAYQGFRWKTIKKGDEISYDLTPGPIGYKLIFGMQMAVAALASAGNNIILDENVIYKGQLEGYLKVLKVYNVIFVGIRCSIDELRKREKQRGNRHIGHVMGHYHLTHGLVDAKGSYDLDIDTTNKAPIECAERIASFLHTNQLPTAFQQLVDIMLCE
jgi:chloramphenicol 3-O phosphotransferase